MEKSAARERIAKNLDFLMESRGWTELELAKRSGIGQKTINNLRNNRHPAKVDTVERVAKAFGLDGWQLLLPDLTQSLDAATSMRRLIENYLGSNLEGQKIVFQIAEREATYGPKRSDKRDSD